MDRISGIIPYNKCFYYNCFHSHLFPIIEKNRGNCTLFLANGIPYFQIQTNETSKRILVRFAFQSDYTVLLAQQGISVRKFSASDWKQVLDKALLNEEPVIVGVDGWYLDYRDDLYHKIHWPHTLLIFGVDQSNKTYLAIDQPTRENMQFSEWTLTSHVLESAYEGFCKQKGHDPLFSADEMILFHFEGNPDPCTAKEIAIFWHKNRKMQRMKIFQGLYKLAEFKCYLMNCLDMSSSSSDACAFVLEGLNDIVKQKRWEVFFLKYLLPSHENCANIAQNLLNYWSNIRNLVGYVFLSGYSRKKTVQHIYEKYEIVLKTEREYAVLAEEEV